MTLIAFKLTKFGDVRWTANELMRKRSPSLGRLVSSLDEPSVFIFRADSNDLDPQQLRAVQWLAARKAHMLTGVSPAALAVLSAAAGPNGPSGELRQLHRSVSQGSGAIDHVLAPRFDQPAVRDALGIAHVAALAGAVASGAADASTVLGPWEQLDVQVRTALGGASGYSAPLLDAIWRAARAASSRDAFESPPTLTSGRVSGPLAQTIRDHYHGRTADSSATPISASLSWREYRRALRWAYGTLHRDQRPPASPRDPNLADHAA